MKMIYNFRSFFSFKQKGITLIEIILVVAIVSTIGLMSATFYSRFLTQNSVANTTDQLINQLRKAQTYSMMSKTDGTNKTWGVRYTTSPRRITLFLNGNAAFDEHFSVNSNIDLTGWTGNETTFAYFTGLPSNTPTITITGSNNTQQSITINSQGVVSKN